MPKATTTTKIFEELTAAVKTSGAKRIQAKAGVKLNIPGVTATLLAPNSDSYEDLNNYSAVLKLTYGKNSFLFTGDAESISESEMLAKKYNLKADVLKIGHHGSSSSTTAAFLKAVSPKYAVISVGKGNDYGHPHKETLTKLANAKIQVYRTDLNGTIVATSDGTKITINKVASPVKANAPPVVKTNNTNSSTSSKYIGNSNTHKFHYATCSSVKKMSLSNKVSFNTRQQAINAGYVPCKICKP